MRPLLVTGASLERAVGGFGALVVFFVRAFPIWVTVGAVLALVHPPLFTWFLDWNLVTPGLQIIMLGMGVTLTFDDFARVARAPRIIFAGVALQYTVMPLLGFAVAELMGLPTPLAVGLILVCSCPGGTASNVIAYLAGADVALSVSMTAVSTLLSTLLTPTLTAVLVGNRLEVDALSLLWDTALVVLLPVAVGVGARRYARRLAEWIVPVAPAAAVVMIVLIVAAILGARREAILDAALPLLLSVFMAHAGGFALGYLAIGMYRGFGREARTVSIEVGMQNSGLAVVLARQNFADPLVAIPGAISAIFHCLIGSALAAVWKRRPIATSDLLIDR